VASDPDEMQRVTQKAMIHELREESNATINKTVPWFLENMPSSYFRQVGYHTRLDHVKAVASLRGADMEMSLSIKTVTADDRRVITFISPSNSPGLILSQLSQLPSYADRSLSRVQIYTSEDNSMCLNMYTYGEGVSGAAGQHNPVEIAGAILDHADRLQDGQYESDPRHPAPDARLFGRDNLISYMQNCTTGYLKLSDHRRFLLQRKLFDSVSGGEGVAIRIEEYMPNPDEEETHMTLGSLPLFWVDMAIANSIPQYSLEHSARVLKISNFDIVRSHLDNVNDGDNGHVTMLRLLVQPQGSELPSDKKWDQLERNLKRQKWLDPATTELVGNHSWLGIRRSEFITAVASLMHPVMGQKNPVAYSKANIYSTITNKRFIETSAKIADLFIDRFDPDSPLGEEEFQQRSEQIRQKIRKHVVDRNAYELLNKMVDVVHHTLRTNLFMEDRYALGFRLDPKLMEDVGDVPYGIFFVHGRRFNGYHVRFRDIARGGMRLVTPLTEEQLSLESGRQYGECYNLAFAQQLKNKDIPEGGSKCVCLIDTVNTSANAKNFIMRKAVKAFTDSILDLIVDTPETREFVVDRFGRQEVLYLGPDEQVIPEDIDWIVDRAAKRGYGTPPAFMSSKPKAGINHKEYGVTSEGVNVFLDVALRETLGIDPTRDSFSVKITGGPDGDVAGNEMKILIREYGDNVKIVGVADHSGCAEDPEGLDHDELMRLFHDALCISHFDESKLNSEGALHLVDSEKGVRMRNTMHNRIEADAFIPAGGRPATIDAENCRNFLKEDGTPSSKLIVEGANLFITPEARDKLFEEAGVLIVKDSSANKCGVICSSYEIAAAMLMSEEEFLENKEEVVADVLVKLRQFAHTEAELIFREYKNYPGSLPYFSALISETINNTTDAVRDELAGQPVEAFLPLVRNHLPKTMADIAFDRITERVPPAYVTSAIASSLASKIVYNEGVNFVKSQPKSQLAELAIKYIEMEKEINGVLEELEGVHMDEDKKRKVIDLIKRGGVRTGLGIF